ncbi:MAG TPA: hypothetical protein PKC76_03745 [Saprospiraceae bacterium]|nr:hypothetical protein [Saprospiraceae bacterium]HMP23215.1 hypothetical protein [Saprospiraceae bacterium]
MKKSTARTLVITLVAAASLSSYVYLNTVASVITAPATGKSLELPVKEVKEKSAEEHREVSLPDVILLEKMIKIGKRFLPAS